MRQCQNNATTAPPRQALVIRPGNRSSGTCHQGKAPESTAAKKVKDTGNTVAAPASAPATTHRAYVELLARATAKPPSAPVAAATTTPAYTIAATPVSVSCG